MKLLKELEIKQLLKTIKPQLEQDSEFIYSENEQLKENLSYYLFLKNYADNILTYDKEVTIENLLYSKYYWFAKFKNQYCSISGYDAGLEQQAFKLTEEIDQQIKDGIDWSIIEQIENDLNL